MERPAFPRIGSVYRSFDSEHERIGVGFLDKSGISRDLIKYRAPSWSLVCVLYGSGRYVLDDGPSFELNAGDCFIRQAGRLHSNYIEASSQWFEAFVDFGPKLADSLTQARIIQRDLLAWRWPLNKQRIERLRDLREQLEHADESALGIYCHQIQSFVIDAQRAARPKNDHDPIEAACHLLSNESLRRDNLRAWVEAQHLDYDKFRKSFKQRIGISPGQYRIRRRMDHACELLQHSDLSITAIAYELGYPTPYEFSAQFKSQMHMTPTQYRG